MSKITVYQYRVVDTNRVEPRTARRWGTRQAIMALKHADIIEQSATRVELTALNESGFTELDFDPRSGA